MTEMESELKDIKQTMVSGFEAKLNDLKSTMVMIVDKIKTKVIFGDGFEKSR